MSNVKFLIDDGHGWFTYGKRSQDGEFRENEFNSCITSRLSYALSQNNLEYDLISPFWKDTPLEQRVNNEHLLYEKGKTVVLSIHADAFNLKSARGHTIFYHSMKGQNLASHYDNYITNANNPIPGRSYRKANYYILKHTKSPAILFELGFMTNKQDRDIMMTEKFRNFITNQILKASINLDILVSQKKIIL